jgi:hypothetical protein
MELESRLVFIDTSAYESKNYQFGVHALGKLEEFIEQEALQLLITDVTVKEIESHLRKYSDESASKIKKIQKEAMFLRNVPTLPCHGIFTKVKGDDIYNIIHEKFQTLLDQTSVEIISSSTVNPEIIFEKYFAQLPPFEKESKKHEFPDAFALEAVNQVSLTRKMPLYIISSDEDMASYADQYGNLIYLSSVDALVDRLIRNTDELKEPAKFADTVFQHLEGKITQDATEYLANAEFMTDEFDDYNTELIEIQIDNVQIADKNIIELTGNSVEFEIEFEVDITAGFLAEDLDRSPWDPEDRCYMFILRNKIVNKYKEIYTAYISISYEDQIKVNAEITSSVFETSTFELSEYTSEAVSYKELDINGE